LIEKSLNKLETSLLDGYNKDEEHSWAYLFSGYIDDGYCMALHTVKVLSSVRAISSPMTSAIGTT